MKNRCKNVSRGKLLALLLSALLLLGMLPLPGAVAEQGGLTIKLRADTIGKLPAGAEVEITLYQIGVADPASKAGWRINDDLSGYRIIEAKTSDDLGKIAAQLASDIVGKSQYRGTAKSLSGGTAVFSGLAAGVYFGMMTKGPEGLEVTPFIVTVPSRDPETKALRYSYDVMVKEKYVEPTPTPTATPEPSEEPTPTPTAEPMPTPTPTTPAPPPPAGNPTPTPTPTTEVTGRKVWVDESNAHKTRPQSITVTLYADGAAVNATPSWSGTDSDTWTYTFAGLPAVSASGATIQYTVRETPVAGYEGAVSGTTITNRLIPQTPKEYTELSGAKTWNDGDNVGGTRPSYITVHLLRDGEEIETRTVTAANGWSYSFGSQPVDDGYGNIYEYTVREDGVPGYFSRADGMNLTNTSLTPDKPTAPGTPNNPDSPYTPTGNIPNRKTSTPRPPFEGFDEEMMDDLLDMLDYGTPLWGGLLGTGDETPVYPYVFGGVGLLAVLALLVFGKKRGKKKG